MMRPHEGGVASLKRNREALKKEFDLGRVTSPSSRFQTSKFLEERDGITVQASKSPADERLKEEPLRSTVFEVLAILGEFSGLDGGCGTISFPREKVICLKS